MDWRSQVQRAALKIRSTLENEKQFHQAVSWEIKFTAVAILGGLILLAFVQSPGVQFLMLPRLVN